MKNLTTIVCGAALIGAGSLALAIDTAATQARTGAVAQVPDNSVDGTIKSVAQDKMSFVLEVNGGAEEQTVRVNESTVYTLDGQTSTRDEALKAGRDANVTMENKVATRVAVMNDEDPA